MLNTIAEIMSFSFFWATQLPCVSLPHCCQLPEWIHSLKECIQWVGTWW